MKKIHNDKNIFVINNFTLLRFGEITHKSAGDFFDNMNPEINLIIAYLSNYENQVNDEYLLVYNSNFGHQLYKNKYLNQVVKQIIKQLPEVIKFPKGLFAGMVCSAERRDADGIIDHSPKYETKFYDVGDIQEVVDEFKESYFSIGSVTHETDAKFNILTNELIHNGKVLEDISELYGRLDDDDAWIIGVMK